MPRILFVFLLLSISFSWQIKAQESSTEDVQKFSLEDAQKYALDHNYEAESARLDIDNSKATVKEIRSIGLPQLNASIDFTHYFKIPTQIIPDFISPSVYGVLFQEGLLQPTEIQSGAGTPAQFGTKNNLNANLELSQLIYDGSYNLGLKAANLFVERAQLGTVKKDQDIKFSISNAYFGVLVIEESIRVLKKTETNLAKVVYETGELHINGFVEEIEVDRLKLSLANLETEIENNQRELESAQVGLKYLMGMDSETPIILTDRLEKFLIENEALITTQGSINDRIESKLLNIQTKFDDLDIRQIKAQYLPNLVGFAGYTHAFQANNLRFFKEEWFPTLVGGLSLNIPIFDGLKKKGQLEQRYVKAKKNALFKENFSTVFELEVSNARKEYVKALNSLNTQKDNIALAQKIYDVSLAKYNEGFGSSLELNAADTELSRTRGLYIQSLYSVVLAINNLNKVLGKY